MLSNTLVDILQKTDTLSSEEQLFLIAHLATRTRQVSVSNTPHRRWSDMKGMIPYPMVGEDAQEWVSRMRQESDDLRERQWSDAL